MKPTKRHPLPVLQTICPSCTHKWKNLCVKRCSILVILVNVRVSKTRQGLILYGMYRMCLLYCNSYTNWPWKLNQYIVRTHKPHGPHLHMQNRVHLFAGEWERNILSQRLFEFLFAFALHFFYLLLAGVFFRSQNLTEIWKGNMYTNA